MVAAASYMIFSASDTAGLTTRFNAWAANMEEAMAGLLGGQARLEQTTAGFAQAGISQLDRVIHDFQLELATRIRVRGQADAVLQAELQKLVL